MPIDPDETADQTAENATGPARHAGPDRDDTPPPDPSGSHPSQAATRLSTRTPGARFEAGTLLAGRYRVVAFLGKGGMGEVYRADDLELAQSVAIKILPARIAADTTVAERVRSEVRLARGITHRNVCRIHDIARLPEEQGGDLFISMEYIDGEDLATLLRRIGKLPQDKSIDVARQLCAALAAAHDQGVIHRDLKPANVMLDGRGQVRLTDFGIAAIDDEFADADASTGTPAYMSPEQYRGESVSRKSDIYSLGLVLFELLTGRPAWKAGSLAELRTLRENTGSPVALTAISELGIDPALAAIVERCTEPDPDDRPTSALAVAAALPGADPLAAAIAAGETPSPELIAASGGKGVLRPATAAAMASASILLTAIAVLLSGNTALLARTGAPPPPAVMRDDALEALGRLGYTDALEHPVRHGWSLSPYSINRVTSAVRENEADWSAFREGFNAPLRYWLRSEPGGFEPRRPDNRVWPDFPARDAPGSTIIQFDQNRRLRYFARMPAEFDREPDTTEPDWSALFELAGLDPDAFEPTASLNSPGTDPAIQRSWKGPAPADGIETRPIELTIYAGARDGRITDIEFSVTNATTDPEDGADLSPHEDDPRPDESAKNASPGPAPPAPEASRLARTLQALSQWMLIGTITIIAGVLAYRNIRLRRADTRRAVRLAAAIFTLTALDAVIGADVPPLSLERLIGPYPIYAGGVGLAFMAAACYIAAEPLARSRWPGSLVSWTRLLSGQFRDPMVGRDTLIGITVGTAVVALAACSPLLTEALDQPATPPGTQGLLQTLHGPRAVFALCLGQLAGALINAAAIALVVLLTMLLLGLVRIRQAWPAIAIVTLLIISQQLTQTQVAPVDRVMAVVGNVAVLFLVGRVGLLATAAALATLGLLNLTATATPIGEWWTTAALTPVALLLAITAFAYRTATAGRSMFQH